jgi:hypothetical protein
MIDIVDDCLPDDIFIGLQSYLLRQPLSYGWKAHQQNDPHGHWNVSFSGKFSYERANLANIEYIIENKGVLYESWKVIRDYCAAILKDPVLIRCYMNAHTYGTDGYFHTDSERDQEYTFIVYMIDEWQLDWAGETVYADEFGEIFQAIIPRRNRGVLFHGNIQHCARGVSRKCPALRVSMVFKVRERRSESFETLCAFLHTKGTSFVAHSNNKSLHSHLCNTFQLLEDAQCPLATCIAGGLHSILGTNIFRNITLPESEIPELKTTFSEEAVHLCLLFRSLDRPRSLEKACSEYFSVTRNTASETMTTNTMIPLAKRKDWKSSSSSSATVGSKASGSTIEEQSEEKETEQVLVSLLELEALIQIECANLQDQNVLNPVKYPALFGYWRSWTSTHTAVTAIPTTLEDDSTSVTAEAKVVVPETVEKTNGNEIPSLIRMDDNNNVNNNILVAGPITVSNHSNNESNKL